MLCALFDLKTVIKEAVHAYKQQHRKRKKLENKNHGINVYLLFEQRLRQHAFCGVV